MRALLGMLLILGSIVLVGAVISGLDNDDPNNRDLLQSILCDSGEKLAGDLGNFSATQDGFGKLFTCKGLAPTDRRDVTDSAMAILVGSCCIPAFLGLFLFAGATRRAASKAVKPVVNNTRTANPQIVQPKPSKQTAQSTLNVSSLFASKPISKDDYARQLDALRDDYQMDRISQEEFDRRRAELLKRQPR